MCFMNFGTIYWPSGPIFRYIPGLPLPGSLPLTLARQTIKEWNCRWLIPAAQEGWVIPLAVTILLCAVRSYTEARPVRNTIGNMQPDIQ
ncbi:hypothetical protein D3C86_1714120 [compost metagenome]